MHACVPVGGCACEHAFVRLHDTPLVIRAYGYVDAHSVIHGHTFFSVKEIGFNCSPLVRELLMRLAARHELLYDTLLELDKNHDGEMSPKVGTDM